MEKENPKKETPEVELFPPDNPMFIMANALIAFTEQLKKDICQYVEHQEKLMRKSEFTHWTR